MCYVMIIIAIRLSLTDRTGSVRDKRIADEYPLSLPPGSVLRQDLGFMGHHPAGVLIEMPPQEAQRQDTTF